MKKNVIKLIAMVLMLAAVCTAFASCGKKLSGKYTGKLDLVIYSYTVSYEFSGKNVTVLKTSELVGNSKTTELKGTYEITEAANGYEITFTYETNDDDIKSGTYSFEEGDDYIKIAGIKYTKE